MLWKGHQLASWHKLQIPYSPSSPSATADGHWLDLHKALSETQQDARLGAFSMRPALLSALTHTAF